MNYLFLYLNALHSGIGAPCVFAQCVNDDFIFLGAAFSDSNQTVAAQLYASVACQGLQLLIPPLPIPDP